jgi:hypothetical protein
VKGIEMKRSIISAIYQQSAMSKMPRFQQRNQWEDEADLFRKILHDGPGSFTKGKRSGVENLSEADRLLGSINESVKALEYFITDLGVEFRCKDPNTSETRLTVPRFGVWEINNRGVEVLEVNENLAYLKTKYRTERVFKVEDVV